MVVVHSLVCGLLGSPVVVQCDVVSTAIFPNNVLTVHWLIATFDPTRPDVVDFGETRCDPLLSILVQFWPNLLLWILE